MVQKRGIMVALYGYYGYGYYYDPMYILIIISCVIALIAQVKVKSTFNKYSRVSSSKGMTGAMVAEQLLRSQGIYDVSIQRVSGSLTDNYNPRNKTLNLSDSVYNSTSVAAIGVAAHETGHAIQHAYGYGPLSFRTALFPLASVGSQVSWILIVLGLIFGSTNIFMLGLLFSIPALTNIGIIFFSVAVFYQIVTLPVEFNASARALQLLESEGFLYGDENRQARKVLSAAAMTYVAAAATAILQLLRLIYLFGGRRRD